jgi:hypothetical protein
MALDQDYRKWPIDRLNFEHQKRRAEISNLEAELSRLYAEQRGFSEFYDDGIQDAQARSGSHLHDYLERGYSDAGIWEDIGRVQNRLNESRKELREIEQALESKWK